MKKLTVFIAIAVVLAMIGIAMAGDTYSVPKNLNGAVPNVNNLTIISAQTATGASSNTFNFGMPMTRVYCSAIFTGSTPTTLLLGVDGSIDGGTTWHQLATNASTSTATGGTIVSTGVGVGQIRGNIISRTSATGALATGATIKCNVLQ